MNDLEQDDPWFIDDPAEYTDFNDRCNRGERIAEQLTAKLRPFDPTVEVAFSTEDGFGDDNDTYYLSFDGISRTPFALDGLESSFHSWKRDIAEVEADPWFKAQRNSDLDDNNDDNNDPGETAPDDGEPDNEDAEYDGQVTHPAGCVWNSVPFKSYAEAYSWVRGVEAKYPEFKSEITKWDAVNYESVIVYKNSSSGDPNAPDNNGEPEPALPPADAFTTKLTAFDSTVAQAEAERDAAKAAYDLAEAAVQNAVRDRQAFLYSTASILTTKLQDECRNSNLIKTATRSGCPVTAFVDNIYIDPTLNGKFVFVTYNNRELARYETPAQVEQVIAQLKDAIARHESEFNFPTVKELATPPPTSHVDNIPGLVPGAAPNTVAAVADICETVNAAAPAGWEVAFDSETKSFPVTFNGVGVTDLDSLALAKALPPEKFFDQFKPLVDNGYTLRQQFLDDRYRELHELQAMREKLGDDSNRAKILDGLIGRLKRDILDAEIEPDEPPEPPTVEYDENGNALPCF